MRRLGLLALTWLALFWLWFAYQAELNRKLIVAGACAATVATALAAHVRSRLLLRGYRLERRWAVRGVKVPWLVLEEFVVVTRVLVRALIDRERPSGSFRLSPFPVGGNEPVARARRAFVAVAETCSPNSYVVGMHGEEGGVLIHDLDPQPPEKGVL
jgi:multisubunit Na+/H+ antiporter MnhE subunit